MALSAPVGSLGTSLRILTTLSYTGIYMQNMLYSYKTLMKVYSEYVGSM